MVWGQSAITRKRKHANIFNLMLQIQCIIIIIINVVNYNEKEASVTLNFNQLRKPVRAEDYFIINF